MKATRTRASAPARLLDSRNLPFVIAAVALVTLGAYENRATITVLPVVARDLDGMAMFGAASALPSATFLIGAALAGLLSDRHGPRIPLLVGVSGFVVSAFTVALAPTMTMLLIGRAVGGFGEAMLDIGLTVLVARALPKALHARMFSMFATAWIVPSLLGPAIAGLINDHFGWRAVFAVGGVAALLVVPALAPVVRRPTEPTELISVAGTRRVGRTLGASAAAAAGVAAVSLGGPELGGNPSHRLTMAGIVLLGVVGIVIAAPTLLPAGTLRARCGASTVVALRALVAAAFALLGSFLPLVLQSTRGLSPAASGVTLSITGLCWAAGSNLSSREGVQRRFTASRRTQFGLGLIVIGGLGVLAFIAGHGSYVFALVLWAVAGTGMGLTSNSLSTALLELAPPESLGHHQSAASTGGVVAHGLSAAAGGSAIALTASGSSAFVGIVAAGVVIAVLALLLVPRMDRDCTGRAA